jgi:hypothetical protein
MKTVKEMLVEFSRVIDKLTDLRKKYKVNIKGQRTELIKIVDFFDESMRNFLSSYFRSVPKANWLNNVCFISFDQCGKKREMILYAAKFKRSKVDISTFPSQDELDQPWRNTLWEDPRKRKTPNASPGPNKKVRVEPITHPLLTLIQPIIPQSIPQPLTPIRPSTHLRQPLLPQLPIRHTISPIPLETLLQAARYRVDRFLLPSFIATLDLKMKIKSLLDTREKVKKLYDRSNAIVRTLFVDHSHNHIKPYIFVEEGVTVTDNQLTLTREKMSIVMD